MLQKGVYPYKGMDDWEKLNERINKQDFYSHINMEDITDANYVHAKQVHKNFEIKNLGDIMIFTFKAIHYFQLMHLRTSEICVLKYTNLIVQNFFQFLD